ncbi:MAG TPA: crotonase/enoyl-CoA hydratase family protein [Trebonia sp.]|nr:crotonase/enoyl-CoA hydratase family protein [Trebonia sp.]
MGTLVSYRSEDGVATLRMDDGKVNVMSSAMLGDINAALDRAEAEKAVVLLTGREGVFSAGFDLRVLREGGSPAVSMVRSGFELAERVLSFPLPVVMACGGHAVAMGLFLLLSGDYRIGADGPYKLTANEVAIGLTMPYAAIEILRQRLAPAYFNRAVTLAEPFAPADAAAGGLVDRVVPQGQLDKVALEAAMALRTLDLDAHAASKLRARGQAVAALRAAIESDYAALRLAGRLA